MSAPLTQADLDRLPSVLGTMLAPHAYGDPCAWGDALCRELAALLPDAMVGLLRATPQGPYTHTPLPLDDQVLYVRHYARLDVASARQATGRLEIAHRWSLTSPDEVRGTAFHEEWLRPRRLADAFWLNTYDAAGARHRVFLNFTEVQDGVARDRVLTLLRLLAPAFQAGTSALDRLGADAEALHRTLDALGHTMQLSDPAGRCLHRTAALQALLGDDPERTRVESAMSAAACDVGALGARRAAAGPATRLVDTARARYTVRATLAPETLAGRMAVVLDVACVPRGAPAAAAAALPDDAALRARFGLTGREATVARLLAERLSDAEIGARLGTSPHTARTHVERVRAKVGVARRSEVAARLHEP
jgi:DNA-binding CsgD family transcriptional regulator